MFSRSLIILLLVVFADPAFAKILDKAGIQKFFLGNTVEFNGGPRQNLKVWLFHASDNILYLKNERMGARQLKTTWEITPDGAYCYVSERFGRRCHRIELFDGPGFKINLYGMSGGPTFQGRILKENAKNFIVPKEFILAKEIAATHPSLVNVKLPPLIPIRSIIASRHEKFGFKLSPNGEKLAWIARIRNRLTVQFRDTEGGTIQTFNHPMSVRRIFWAPDNRHILFLWNLGRQNVMHLFILDTQNPKATPRDLTPFERVRVKLRNLQTAPNQPILIEMNKRTGKTYDLYELNLANGDHKIIGEYEKGLVGWLFRGDGTVLGRFLAQSNGRTKLQIHADDSFLNKITGAKWKDVFDFKTGDFVRFYSPPKDSNFAWILTNAGLDKKEFQKIDLKTGKRTTVYKHDSVDLVSASVSHLNYQLNWVTKQDDISTHDFIDKNLSVDFKAFKAKHPGRIHIISTDRKMEWFVVNVTTNLIGQKTYLFNRVTKVEELFSSHGMGRYSASLSKINPIEIKSRDGLTLRGYLTIPRNTNGKNLPTILKVHGGPWLRSIWGLRSYEQILANRGYAVLDINFRGSKGFGNKFELAGRRQFAGKMQDDLNDTVDWAIEKGISDPKKIVIWGGSYGGYAALAGLTFTPNKFAGGISLAGPTDLKLQINSFPPFMRAAKTKWRQNVGDPNNPDDLKDMEARSPINFVEKITRPILLFHGAKDVRVPKAHSDNFVAKLKEYRKASRYTVFHNEGHGIRRLKNRELYMKEIEAFLAKHLGGRKARYSALR